MAEPTTSLSAQSPLHWDWQMHEGVAGPINFVVLLAFLLSFPLLLRWTGALALANIDPQSPQHTPSVLKFCAVLTLFLSGCFFIALVGIRGKGAVNWRELIGARWLTWGMAFRDLGIALGTLLVMGAIGNISNALLGRVRVASATFHAMVARNTFEALAFLVPAITAGFVEEFVFRGYIQRQCQAFCGNTFLASALQILIFTQGHSYQGWIRLIPVFLIGTLLTLVALWRKSLVPGMIAHGLGDGLVGLMFLAKHL